MPRFLLASGFLMAALLLGVFAGVQQHWISRMPTFSFEIVLFLGLTTIILYRFLVQRSRAPSFTQAYLISMIFKMIAYAVFILVIILQDRTGAPANALLFLIGYVLFTALEVGFLFKSVNQ